MKLVNRFSFPIKTTVVYFDREDHDVGSSVVNPEESILIEDHWDVVEVSPHITKPVIEKAVQERADKIMDRLERVNEEFNDIHARLEKLEAAERIAHVKT